MKEFVFLEMASLVLVSCFVGRKSVAVSLFQNFGSVSLTRAWQELLARGSTDLPARVAFGRERGSPYFRETTRDADVRHCNSCISHGVFVSSEWH